jgi:hemoglobin
MKDITNREDIVFLVDSFYEKVKADELLAPKFQHLDWPKHLPIMYNFWSSMLLGDQSYQGNPFQKHTPLSINAEETKSRAQSIAEVWQHKMGLMN